MRVRIVLLVLVLSAVSAGAVHAQSAPRRGLSPYMTETFDAYPGAFYTSAGSPDMQVNVADGALVIGVPANRYQADWPGLRMYLGNGSLATTVDLSNAFAAGVIARETYSPGNKTTSFYVCMASMHDWAACWLKQSTGWTQLFSQNLASGVVTPVSTLVVAMVGDHLKFWVNGELAISIRDSTLEDGHWGLIAESSDTHAGMAAFEDVSIAIAPHDYDMRNTPADMAALVAQPH